MRMSLRGSIESRFCLLCVSLVCFSFCCDCLQLFDRKSFADCAANWRQLFVFHHTVNRSKSYPECTRSAVSAKRLNVWIVQQRRLWLSYSAFLVDIARS